MQQADTIRMQVTSPGKRSLVRLAAIVLGTAIFATAAGAQIPVSDSDFVFVVPSALQVSDSVPVEFGMTLVLNNHTRAQSLTIPLTFAGPNPNLKIDTTKNDGVGNLGITQKALGGSSVWTIRTSLVDNVKRTILLGYVSFGDPLPKANDSLAMIHFTLTPGGGPGMHGLDTTLLPPANHLAIIDVAANEYTMQWLPATISIAGDTAAMSLEICLWPGSLSFTAIQQASLPPSKTFTLSSCGTGTLNWSIADDSSDWLLVSPLVGTGNLATVNVAITTTNLPAGLYQSTLIVSDTSAVNSPQFVDVSYVIQGPEPHICVSPSNLVFRARQGTSPPTPQTFAVINCGGLGLNWYALEYVDWMNLTVSPPWSDSGWVSVAINTTNLPPGTYQADVTIIGTNADNSPQYVHVTYDVSGSTSDSDRVYLLPSTLVVPESPGSKFALSLMLDTHSPAQALTIPLTFAGPNLNLRIDTTFVDPEGNLGVTQGNLGGDSLWTVRTTLVDNAAGTLLLGYVSFENALPPSQDTLATIHFDLEAGGGWGLHEVDTAYLGPFNQLFITDPDANDIRPQWGPAAVWIGELGAGPILCLSTHSLNFAADQGGVSPPAQWLGIFNCGDGVMAWEVAPDVPWLEVTPAAGVDDSGYVTVLTNTTALAPGMYVGNLTVSSDQAGNAPETVSVAYTINPPDSSVADSDFIWIEPPALAIHSDVDTGFSLTVKLTNHTPAAAITLPLTWAGPNANLTIDTTIGDGFGNRGITQGPLGIDTLIWTIRSMLIDPIGHKVLIGYVSFGDPLPPSSGDLVSLHFLLAADGAEGTHVLDTTLLPGATFSITDPSAWDITPRWSPGFISIAGTRIPQLCLSTHSLSFIAEANTPPPPAKQFLISNCGGGTLNWDVSENIPWLMLQPLSGSDSAYVLVTVTSTQLTPGIYHGDIVVNGVIKHPDTVRVTYTVLDAPTQPTDFIYLTPNLITLPTGVDTSFDITIMLHISSLSNPSAITIPLTFAGSGPKVTIDTTISDGLGNYGVTQRHLGSDSFWENIHAKVDNVNQTILLGYLDFNGSTFGAVDDSLVTIHFKLAASAAPVLIEIDTTFIPPGNVLSILDQNALDHETGWFGSTITTGTTGSDDEPARPGDYALDQNYPNPFNAGTRVQFNLLRAGYVELKIFNLLGMPVRTLVARNLSAGIQTVQWDGADDFGRPVASGTYFYRLRVGSDFEETRAMTLLR